jgi:predicted nucleic acid-binding protein
MILLDSNILIYSAEEEYKYLRELYKDGAVSEISRLEVLGYHRITSKQVKYFDSIYQVVTIFQLDTDLINMAINYRQKKSMSTADAIIAATAKMYGCDLYTNNVPDFKNIKDFKIINPLIK